MTHSSPKRNMVPKVVLMRSGLVSLTTARPVNTAQPRTTVNSARRMKMPKAVVNTAKPKAVLNAVKGNQVNAVKASACWVYLYLLVLAGRYVVPTGRVIATVSIKVPTGWYVVPAGYIISLGRVT
ncbi:hypothetical protein Tco_1156785 [Tanacetum coccineum]